MAYAPVSFTYGNTAQRTVNLTFPILSRNHVVVTYNGVTQPNNNTIYRFNSDSQIFLVTPPAAGTLVKVSRVTPSDPLVSFNAGAVIPVADLNTATRQALYRVEELLIVANASVAYGDLVGVPATFPPSTHNHDASTIFSTGVVPSNYLGTGARTGAKFLRDDNVWADPPSASGAWGHISGDIYDQGDLAVELNGKAPVSHEHPISMIEGLQAALDAKLATAQAGSLGLALLGAANPNSARNSLGIYVQDTDPGVVPDGSIWITTSA